MKDIYNKFSEDYDKLFFENVVKFKNDITNYVSGNKEYATFYPSFGIKEKENCDFLILGQAVNGWGSAFDLESDLIYEEIVSEAVKYSNNYLKDLEHSPLDWVNIHWTKRYLEEHRKKEIIKNFYKNGDYVTCRSFFWNVTFKLICDYYNDLDRDSWNWSKRMVWSNLYKIAPDGANPNGLELNIQEEYSLKLIKKEIEELNPKYCIVLTNGKWWIPFQEKLNSLKLDYSSEIIHSFEQFNETKIIVTSRPFVGNSDKHVNEILSLIKQFS
jgi:hypothetical protein